MHLDVQLFSFHVIPIHIHGYKLQILPMKRNRTVEQCNCFSVTTSAMMLMKLIIRTGQKQTIVVHKAVQPTCKVHRCVQDNAQPTA